MSATAEKLFEQIWTLPEEERLQIRRALNQGMQVLDFGTKGSEGLEPWRPTAEQRAKAKEANAGLMELAGIASGGELVDFDASNTGED